MIINGAKEAARKSEKINQKDRGTWVKLYYSIQDRRIYTQDGAGRYHVCDLLNPCTPEQITDFVNEWRNS